MTKPVLGKQVAGARRKLHETIIDLVLVATDKADFVTPENKNKVIEQLNDELIDRTEHFKYWNDKLNNCPVS